MNTLFTDPGNSDYQNIWCMMSTSHLGMIMIIATILSRKSTGRKEEYPWEPQNLSTLSGHRWKLRMHRSGHRSDPHQLNRKQQNILDILMCKLISWLTTTYSCFSDLHHSRRILVASLHTHMYVILSGAKNTSKCNVPQNRTYNFSFIMKYILSVLIIGHQCILMPDPL